MDIVLLAVDGGPRETLLPLAAAAKRALEDVTCVEAADESHWRRVFESRSADLLVVGTSDSAAGRRVEAAARRAAGVLSLPIVAIEDFPGNYSAVTGGEATRVFVESLLARSLHAARPGVQPAVEVISPARYDTYRVRLTAIREATRARWASASQTSAAPRVLWAGQPETEDGVRTLSAVLPVLRGHRAELLFKAHPRDPGYASGAYGALLQNAGVSFQDVTAASIAEVLDIAPRLVVTQFSSVAIEAGFYGIPSFCIVLPDAGGARLRDKKGYDVPLFCTAGAAACAGDAAAVAPIFTKALSDESFRARLMREFDRYFDVHTLQTQPLLDLLKRAAGQRK